MISYQAEYFLCAAHIYDVYTRYKNQIAAAIVCYYRPELEYTCPCSFLPHRIPTSDIFYLNFTGESNHPP